MQFQIMVRMVKTFSMEGNLPGSSRKLSVLVGWLMSAITVFRFGPPNVSTIFRNGNGMRKNIKYICR